MRSVCFTLFLFSAVISLAQSSVEGTVIDSETNTPLPGANVFIANTTKGVVTDVNGKFKITGLRPVNYQLVISFTGYKTNAFDIVPKQNLTYRVLLLPNVEVLGEVIVRARNLSRAKYASYLRSFSEHFIGRSDNSSTCRIENPDVLILDEEGNELTAKSDRELILINKGLGYRVRILLETYRFNTVRNAVHYEGHMVYEQLVPADEAQRRRWAKNRLNAYYGSEMHFLRSLYNHRANEEGYYFYFVSPIESDTVVKVRSRLFNNRYIKMPRISDDKIIDSVMSTKEAPVLKFSRQLEITYIHEGESAIFQRAMKAHPAKAMQVSQMRMRAPAYILPDGRIAPLAAAEIGGYWGWELMAEALPLDYEPDEDLKITKGKY